MIFILHWGVWLIFLLHNNGYRQGVSCTWVTNVTLKYMLFLFRSSLILSVAVWQYGYQRVYIQGHSFVLHLAHISICIHDLTSHVHIVLCTSNFHYDWQGFTLSWLHCKCTCCIIGTVSPLSTTVKLQW